jgi:hypothetical protein
MFRRKFIKATGVTALGGVLAGCTGNSDTGGTETSGGSGAETTSTQTTSGAETTAGTDDLDLAGEVADDSPKGLEVTNRELYQQNGEVGLRGAVENTSDVTYESIEAEVTLQDDKGDVLYEFIDETEEEQTQTLTPDATWQFDVVFEEAKMAKVTSYRIELDGDRAQTTADEGTADEDFDLTGDVADDTPKGLEVSDRELYRKNGEVALRGTVTNTGDVAYESAEVEVTLQDDQGEVLYEFIDETEEAQTQTLTPDATWQFDVVFEEAKMAEVSKYRIELDGDRAQTTADESA